MLKETNPILKFGSESADKASNWIRNLFNNDTETTRITNAQDTKALLSNTSYAQAELSAINTTWAPTATEKAPISEGLGSKFDNFAEQQAKATGAFSSGMTSLLEAIQGIRIPAPIIQGQNIPSNIPSDIDALGMLMTNKI